MSFKNLPVMIATTPKPGDAIADPDGCPCLGVVEPKDGGWALFFSMDGSPKLFLREGQEGPMEHDVLTRDFSPGHQVSLLPMGGKGRGTPGVVHAITEYEDGRLTYDVRVRTPDGRPGRIVERVSADRMGEPRTDEYPRLVSSNMSPAQNEEIMELARQRIRGRR